MQTIAASLRQKNTERRPGYPAVPGPNYGARAPRLRGLAAGRLRGRGGGAGVAWFSWRLVRLFGGLLRQALRRQGLPLRTAPQNEQSRTNQGGFQGAAGGGSTHRWGASTPAHLDPVEIFRFPSSSQRARRRDLPSGSSKAAAD